MWKIQKEKEGSVRKVLDEQVRKKEKEGQGRNSRARERLAEGYDPISIPIDVKLDLGNRYLVGMMEQSYRKSLVSKWQYIY